MLPANHNRRPAVGESQRRHDKHGTTAHRRGASAQGRCESVQLPAAQHVVLHRAHPLRPHDGNANQGGEVDAKDSDDPSVQEWHWLVCLPIFSRHEVRRSQSVLAPDSTHHGYDAHTGGVSVTHGACP